MLDLEGDNLRQGLLALVVALLEVVKEALVHAAVGRVEGGRLSDAEIERLGDALAELEDAVDADQSRARRHRRGPERAR